MTTAETSQSQMPWVRPDEYPIWFDQFSAAERDQMIEDDLDAGRHVPALLTAVILIGVTLAIITLLALSY